MTDIKEYQDKDGNKLYQFQLYLGTDPVTGKKKKTRRRGFKTQKEAHLALSRLEIQLQKGELNSMANQNSTFNEVYDLWFTQYKQTVKESTWVTTERIFRLHITPVFGDYRISKITIRHCQQAINGWFNAGLLKYHTFLNYVGKVLDFAINIGLISDNPAKRVIVPKNKSDRSRDNLENYYNKEELEHFFECLHDDPSSPQAYPFFRLLAFSGMRKGEALALTWEDINFRDNTISINKTQSRGDNAELVIQSPKTRRSNRTIFIDDKTISVLQHWQLEQRKYLLQLGVNVKQKESYVFTNEHGKMFQPSKPRKWLEHTLKRYDLNHVTVHAFRHTYATMAFEAGATIKSVQEQLGHSSYKTTMDVYTAVTKSKQNEATTKLAKYLNF